MRAALIFVFIFMASFSVSAFNPSPMLSNVVDDADVLTEYEKVEMYKMIQSLQDKADVWAAVYFTESLDGDSIETAAEQTFRAWELGEAGKDNGLLLMFSMQDRKMRIEVGYGLEGEITDALSARLIREVLVPNARAGTLANGVSETLARIGYQVSKDESFLRDRNLSPLPKEDGSVGNDDFNAKSGFHAWLVWVSLLFFIPALKRVIDFYRIGAIPRTIEIPHLLHLDSKFAWGMKAFLAVNPGIFIFIAQASNPHGIIGLAREICRDLAAGFSNLIQTADFQNWLLMTILIFGLRSLLRIVCFAIGSNRSNSNPVYRDAISKKFRYLLTLRVLDIFTAFFWTVFSTFIIYLSFTPVFYPLPFLILYYWDWRSELGPLLSESRYKRKLARERLHRIKTRVTGTREIFGRSYTYTPSRSSSFGSSSRSSFSSSSGGGRSGGGGASGSW